jgi:hypothetical protein
MGHSGEFEEISTEEKRGGVGGARLLVNVEALNFTRLRKQSTRQERYGSVFEWVYTKHGPHQLLLQPESIKPTYY